jgi:hypothetical protein
MLSQYGSFRQQLADADWSLSIVSGGDLVSNDTIEFFVQSHNRVGLNKLSTGKQVTTGSGSKIRLSINSSAIASGEDTFKFVISARRGLDTPKQIAEIYVRESNQYTFKQLPISIDFTKPDHVSTNLVQPLSSGDDRIHGQIRIVEGVSHRYDSLATTGEVQSSPGYWVIDSRSGIVNIDNTKGQYGADQRTSIANLVIPSRLSTEGDIKTEPIIFWWSNNLESNLGNFSPSGMGLNLKIYLNGALTNSQNIPYGNLFSNLITIRFLGYVNVATGAINTSLQDVNIEKQWTPTASGMTLPANLDPGYAAAYAISVEFSGDLLATMIATGGTVGIELTREPTLGVYEPSTGVLGNSVLEGLYVLPEQMLPGVATLANYRVTYRTPSFFIGLEPDTANQKVVITNSSSGLVRVRQGDLANGQYLRAIVGTVSGTQSISQFSSVQGVTTNSSIGLTINYPVNSSTGLAIVRGDYPDTVAGNNQATFNVPEIIIYLHDTDDNIYYQLPPIPVITGTSQQITISNLDNATQINPNNLPSSSSSFGLFGYLNPTVAVSSVLGNLPFNLFRVAIAYHYPDDNLAITSVSHSSSQGCLPQVRGSLADSLENNLYWLTPAATVAIARQISVDKLIDGAILLVIETETLYRYDSYSSATDDGELVLIPNAITGAGRFIALANGVGEGAGVDSLGWADAVKGELISWTGNAVTLVPRGQNGYYLKSDDSSPSGLSWAAVTSGSSLSFPLTETPNQVVYNTSLGTVALRRMWDEEILETSPANNCLAITNVETSLTPNETYFNVIPTPTGTARRVLMFNPSTKMYSWENFTIAGLLDSYGTSTTVAHNSQLFYDASIAKWIPRTQTVEIRLPNLADTFIDSPADNYPLIWDNTSRKFIVGMPELSAIEGLNYTSGTVTIPGDSLWNNTKVLVSTRNLGQDLRGTLSSIAVVNTSISTSSPYSTGISSYQFTNVGLSTNRQFIQIATIANTIIGGNPFALELFFRPAQLSSGKTYTLAARNNDVETDFTIVITETLPNIFNVKFFGYSAGGIIEIQLTSNIVGGLLVDTWYHLAVTRNGNDWRLFVDGAVQQLITSSANLFSAFTNQSQIFLTLGRINDLPINDDTQYIGLIEDFRLTLGNARYFANFTPPTSPLPATSGMTRNVKDYFISFAGLIDVDDTVTPQQDWVPSWSITQNKYIPKPIGSGGEVVSLFLNQLTNVDISSSTTNNFLAKDSDGIWRGRAIGSGVTSINGLSGVVTLTSDQITQGTTNLFLTPGAIATQLAVSNLEQLSNVQDSIANNLYLQKVNGIWQGANITFPVTGVNNKTGNITLSTADINEGVNLYYTNTRVATHVNTLGISSFGGVFTGTPTTGKIVSVDSSGKLTFTDPPSGSSLTNTDGLTEGGVNLYYTNTRVATHVNTLGISSFGGVFTGTPTTGKIVSVDSSGKLTFTDPPSGSLVNTDGLTEGTTNLYYTNTRVATHVNTLSISSFGGVFTGTPTTGKIVSVDANGKLAFIDAPSGSLINTDGLTEGGNNLYYTNSRVSTHVNTLTISDFNGVFTGTPTTGTIPSVDTNGKLAFGNPVPLQEFKTVTGNYSLLTEDHGRLIRITNTSIVTLPTGFSPGFQVTFFNETNSTITFSSTGTIKAKASTCSNQYGAVYATHQGSNVWILLGDLG